MDTYFHLPSFTQHFSLNYLLIEYMEKHPEYFKDGLKIASVFGSFDGSLWNGGRVVPGKFDPVLTQKIIKAFNDKGIPLRYTFTNPHVSEKHLADKACNEIMKMGDNGLNQVIVMSPVLEQYIRENYPNYKITSSTCKQIKDMDGVNAELEKNYNLVVLDYNWNNKFDMLEQVKDKGRCEILVNACCQPNCQRRGDHYSEIGKRQIELCNVANSPLGISPNQVVTKEFECPFMSYSIYDIQEFSTFISAEAIDEKYLPMGYNQFKIEGRTIGDVKTLETYIYYFVKKEFANRVRLDMLNSLTGRIQFFNIMPK